MSRSRYSITSLTLIAILVSLVISAFGNPAAPALAQGNNVVVVNTGALHIRSGPAPNTTVLGTVAGGTELAVTGRNAAMTWWRVSSPFGVGWVSDQFVAFRGNIDSVPVVSTPQGTLETPVIYVDRYPATVYSNPNLDSFVIGMVPAGGSLPIIGRSFDGNWWQVSTSMGPGWVNIADVALRGDEDIVERVGDPGPSFRGPTVRLNAGVQVTTQPGGGDVIADLPAGTTIPTRSRSVDNAWWEVTGDFGFGWIPVGDVSLMGASSTLPVAASVYTRGPAYTGGAMATAIIEVDRKVAYGLDSYDSDPMWDARLGEQLGVLARNPNGLWLEVVKSNGWTGWLNFSGITLQGSMAGLPVKDTDPVIENIVIVNTGRLNIRSGPGAEYAALTSAPGGTTLHVTGRHPTLPWIRVEGHYGVGWVRILYIIFRGDWEAVPIVTEPVGSVELPQAYIHIPHDVYARPALDAHAGVIPPGSYTIIAWSPRYEWAQILTDLGKVWIPKDEFDLRGNGDNAPIIPV